MRLNDFLNNVEIQVSYRVCYYDYDSNERVFVDSLHYGERTIRYIYVENDEIFIELDDE